MVLRLATPRHANTLDRLPALIQAGVRCFHLETEEESRAVELLERHAETGDMDLRLWSAASGVDEDRVHTPLLEGLGAHDHYGRPRGQRGLLTELSAREGILEPRVGLKEHPQLLLRSVTQGAKALEQRRMDTVFVDP